MSDLTGPRQTILITSRSEAEVFGKEIAKDNIMAAAWHMPVSHEPKMYAIAITKDSFTLTLIRKSGNFCVNFMSWKHKDQVLNCGRTHGAHTDKYEETGFTNEECDTIDCHRIKEALGYLECELKQEVEAGDHIILIGRVTHSDLKAKDKRIYHIAKDEFTTTVD